MAIVRLNGLGQLENVITSSGMEPATFRLLELGHGRFFPNPFQHIINCLLIQRCLAWATECFIKFAMNKSLSLLDVLNLLVGHGLYISTT
jgi:hypothetical protein